MSLKLQHLKQRLQNILIELNLSILELQDYNDNEIKNHITLETITNNELNTIHNNLKALDFLKDLDHVFKTGKNILELILSETIDISVDTTSPTIEGVVNPLKKSRYFN